MFRIPYTNDTCSYFVFLLTSFISSLILHLSIYSFVRGILSSINPLPSPVILITSSENRLEPRSSDSSSVMALSESETYFFSATGRLASWVDFDLFDWNDILEVVELIFYSLSSFIGGGDNFLPFEGFLGEIIYFKSSLENSFYVIFLVGTLVFLPKFWTWYFSILVSIKLRDIQPFFNFCFPNLGESTDVKSPLLVFLPNLFLIEDYDYFKISSTYALNMVFLLGILPDLILILLSFNFEFCYFLLVSKAFYVSK